MRRIAQFVLVLIALSTAAPARLLAQSADDLTKFRNRETSLWESVKNKELDQIRKVFDKNYVAVYDYGIVGLAQEVDGISKMTMRSYRLSDVKLNRIDNLNVIVAYRVDLEGEAEGQSMSGAYNAMTLWHRRGNQWSVAAHTEVKAK
jgi:hypothetical protein